MSESAPLKIVQMSDFDKKEKDETETGGGDEVYGFYEQCNVNIKTFSSGKIGIEVSIWYSDRDLDVVALEVANAYIQVDGVIGTWGVQREREIQEAAQAVEGNESQSEEV